MTRLISSLFLILGLVGLVLFSKQTVAHATQDCSKYSNNPPYYERCMQIQKSIQRMNDSKAKRSKRSRERQERVNKGFSSQRALEAKKKENVEKETTNPENTETSDNATGTPDAQTSVTDTMQTTDTTIAQDPHAALLKNIPPKDRIIIDSRKLTSQQRATIYSIITQMRAQPATQQPAATTPVQNTQKPVTKTIRRPTRPMTPISPSSGKRMIKLPDVGMGGTGFAPIEPLDPDDLSRP